MPFGQSFAIKMKIKQALRGAGVDTKVVSWVSNAAGAITAVATLDKIGACLQAIEMATEDTVDQAVDNLISTVEDAKNNVKVGMAESAVERIEDAAYKRWGR